MIASAFINPDANLHLQRHPIATFCIPSNSHAITPEEWTLCKPNIVWYGVPVKGEYQHPQGGTYKWYQLKVFNQECEVLGYLPLPHCYTQAWTQLCYSVMYWMTIWKAWVIKRE